MAWIEFHEGLREHWKVQRLADALGGEYLYALGAISCLWLWCVQYAQDGELKAFTDAEIRLAARTKSEKFSKKTLIACELLNAKEQINDWRKHGIKLLESRRKRQREYMQRKRRVYGRVYEKSTSTIPNLTNINTKENSPAEALEEKEVADKVDAFNCLLNDFPTKLGASSARRLFFQWMVTDEMVTRIRKGIENYKKHLKNNSWKTVMNFGKFLEQWTDWENHVEVETEDQKLAKLKERLKVRS